MKDRLLGMAQRKSIVEVQVERKSTTVRLSFHRSKAVVRMNGHARMLMSMMADPCYA